MERAAFAPIVVMAQSSSPTHPISEQARPASRGPSVLSLAGFGLAGLALAAALALWFHFGSQVFFEMISAGFAACL